jgi:NADP-dependent 3-hydroxy acid dehydrogenase YdfG
MSAPFADNVVVITGASSGICSEMARQFSDQGAKLVLSARRV